MDYLPRYEVIYQTTHSRCIIYLVKSDYRISDLDSLMKVKDGFQQPMLYCHRHQEMAPVTLIDVLMFYGVKVKPIIENMVIEEFGRCGV